MLLSVFVLFASAAVADPLRATFQQGALHAFLVVRDEGGKIIGIGDVMNVRMGNAWKLRMTLKFNDGSVDDETAVYQQHTTLRLLTDHHIQKGPSYPKPMDMSIDVAKKTVTWHDFKDGKDDIKTDTMDLPADLCNGLLALVIQDMPKGSTDVKMSYIAATPKPRIVKLAVHPDGQDRFHFGDTTRQAGKFRLHIELGGVVGVIAPIVGKEPPDIYIWVVQGEVPTFLRMNGALFEGAPIWNLELSSPTWPVVPGSEKAADNAAQKK
jgi:hypothetical protein